ncbi:MAG: T9SS type A sorting domain-containing protein, partial [Bacteroidia bacterium]
AGAEAMTLNIINELGQRAGIIELNSDNNYSANLSGLSNGVYFITGQSQHGTVKQKVIIND